MRRVTTRLWPALTCKFTPSNIATPLFKDEYWAKITPDSSAKYKLLMFESLTTPVRMNLMLEIVAPAAFDAVKVNFATSSWPAPAIALPIGWLAERLTITPLIGTGAGFGLGFTTTGPLIANLALERGPKKPTAGVMPADACHLATAALVKAPK
jgi:hypothetical protein